MPVTARNFGLRVGNHYDERTDYFKSTHAASRYLTDLFATYGDWLLVIAAYNGGPGNVNAAIKKSGSKDFWKLQNYLPQESKNHVKKFIATHFIMEGQGGITTSTKDEIKDLVFTVRSPLTQVELDSSKTLQVAGRYNSVVLIKHLDMNLLVFNKYNPDFDKVIATEGTYELRLPYPLMESFLEKKSTILNESIQLLLDPTTKKAF
jgi:membrane-bound lytic murein transglycosylase D